MRKKSLSQALLLLGICLFLSACFSTNQTRPNEPQIVEHSDEKITHTLIQEVTEPPLFTHIIPTLDPVMWTNESDDSLAINPGVPLIVGGLPGQRELPIDLFEEAAGPYNLSKQSSVLFVKDNKETDLWQRIRDGFAIPHQINPRIQSNINWYARHQNYMDRVATRAEKYLHFIVEETERMGVPLEIALLPIVESAFQPFAYSHGRAAGLWQFIPGTGKMYGLKQNWWYDGRRDVAASTRAALKYLSYLHRKLDNDWLLALAAYNSGSGTVRKAIRKNKRKNKPTDYWSLDLPRETRDYVPKLLAIAEIISDPDRHNIQLTKIKNEPYLAEVDTTSQIDLALAAELAEISMETLYILNPGYNRWATDPDGPHKLMVPIEKADIFKENLATLPANKRLAWKRHNIKKGQSLLAIAKKYNTSVDLIKDLNQIRGNMIRAGKSLIVPISSRANNAYTLSVNQRLLAKQNSPKKGKGKTTYTVKPGDSFWSISRKFNVGYGSLAKWNGLAPRDILRPGQKLVIWTKRARAKSKRVAFSPHSSKMMTQKINYKIRRGDSLARISQKFNVEISDLKRWNKRLSKQKYIQPGQRLTIHIDITNQAS